MQRRPPPRCSTAHPSCTRAHWLLVESYRAAREADEQRRDVACGGMKGSPEWAHATAAMITFKTWLTSSVGNTEQREAA